MIDEKKLIEDIWSLFNNEYNNAVKYDEDETKLADKILSHVQKKIEAQLQIGQWIPCSERLPEESLNSVIGWDEYRKRCCFVQYYAGQWQLAGKNKYGESVKIIAWQPVPEPYKPKGE